MRERRIRQGKWGQSHLTAVTISRLMGCAVSTTKRYLKRLRESLDRDLTDDEVGELIRAVREIKRTREVNSYFRV